MTNITTKDELASYRKALETARIERAKLLEEVAASEQKIASLDRTIAGLSELLGIGIETQVGLTEAISFIFRIYPNAVLTPLQLREKLAEQGIRISGSNPMANVHTTLRRLEEKGEITDAQLADGSKGYTRALKPMSVFWPSVSKSEKVGVEEPGISPKLPSSPRRRGQ